MLITRKVEFSASHVCRAAGLTEEENAKLFGPAANPHGPGPQGVERDSEPRSRGSLRSSLPQLRSAAVRPRGADGGEHRAGYLAAARTEAPAAGTEPAQRAGLRDARPVRRVPRRRAVFRVTRRYRFAAS